MLEHGAPVDLPGDSLSLQGKHKLFAFSTRQAVGSPVRRKMLPSWLDPGQFRENEPYCKTIQLDLAMLESGTCI